MQLPLSAATAGLELLDLSRVADAEIQGESVLGNTLRLSKYSRSRHLLGILREILELISQALPAASFADWVQAIGVDVMTMDKNIDHEQYKPSPASCPTQFEPGSLADRLLMQGREEGREVGERLGVSPPRL